MGLTEWCVTSEAGPWLFFPPLVCEGGTVNSPSLISSGVETGEPFKTSLCHHVHLGTCSCFPVYGTPLFFSRCLQIAHTIGHFGLGLCPGSPLWPSHSTEETLDTAVLNEWQKEYWFLWNQFQNELIYVSSFFVFENKIMYRQNSCPFISYYPKY